MKHVTNNSLTKLVLASQLLVLSVVVLFPMVTDEAYYIDWARRSSWPSLGFFDHPPVVSWIATLSRMFHHILAARIFVWLSSLASLYFIWRTTHMFAPSKAWSALTLVATSIGGIAGGFLLTPDTGMTLMWSIALHESVVALRGSPKRWISAGVATGIGLLSKYTMVLMGPVFLWGLVRQGKGQLKTRWPYLGALTCILVFAPHVWWQSQNQWITFKFQFGHGFSVKQSITQGSILPLAKNPDPDSPTMKLREDLLKAMSNTAGFAEFIKKPKPDKSKWEQAWQYVGDYIGGVSALWGLYSLVAIAASVRLKSKRKLQPTINPLPINDHQGLSLVFASAFFPVLFFGVLSPFTKIEANWPAMHMGALGILAALYWDIPSKILWRIFVIHTVLIGTLGFVLMFPGSFSGARNNRLLLESKGFQALGKMFHEDVKDGFLAVDSYQLKSAIRYYAPNIQVAQWPGITRGSEYTRGFTDDLVIEQAMLSQPNITVLSMNPFPQILEGFEAIAFEGIRVCPDGSIGIFSVQNPSLPCEQGLREWWLTRYRAVSSATPQ